MHLAIIDTHFSGMQVWIITCSFLFAIDSIIFFLKNKIRTALFLLFSVSLLLRLMMTTIDPYIHLWDEQFHALVAKNMMQNPFTPMMYANPVLDYDYTQWWSNHVWLHKQPLFLWCIAISYKIFGLNEFALRLPF